MPDKVGTRNVQIQCSRKNRSKIMDEKKTSYRKYAEEFKLEALELLKSSGKSAGQIERDLGINARAAREMARAIPSHYPKGEGGK